MRIRGLSITMPIFLLASVSLAQTAGEPPQGKPGAPGASYRFAATLAVPSEGGAAQSIDVSLGKLLLTGGRKIDAPPLGYYVVTVVAGELISSIAGKETQRHPGDTWAVNAGETMSVQLQGKSTSALLQILTVKDVSPTK